MRMTQEEYDNYIAQRVQQAEQRENNRKHIVGTLEYARQATYAPRVKQNAVPDKQGIGVTPAKRSAGLKLDSTQKKSLVVVLPFKLPTWNVLLAMGVWQRKKERDRIHAAVLRCIASAKG